jgi:trans-aconitate methyltransferase
MDVAATWQYGGGDGCADFFTQMVRASHLDVPATSAVLEIGCAEFDWLTKAKQSWPEMTLTGIDWRGRKKVAPGVTLIAGDVMAHDWPAESFDWIVSISAIEHIGLGHYHHDPKAEDGDAITMRRVWEWLKPGGVVTFDVPWNAGTHTYQVVRTSHRIYDDAAVESRLAQGLPWVRQWTGAAHAKRPQHLLTDLPQLEGGEHFYYRGFVWRKP